MPRHHVETAIEASRLSMKFGGFTRSATRSQPYLIELADVSLLFTAAWAAYDEPVEEDLWASGAS